MVTDTNFEKNENPTFIDGCNIGGKRGIYVKGENVIHLDTPEICFPENAPLHNTDKRELYAILDELFQDGSGGGDDDWSPPDMPEPNDYEFYMIVHVIKENSKFEVRMSLLNSDPRYESVINHSGWGQGTIDWGDGTVDSWVCSDVEVYLDTGEYTGTSFTKEYHTYAECGEYLLHFSGTKYNSFFNLCRGYNYVLPKAAKFGKEILLTELIILGENKGWNNDVSRLYNLEYIKFNGNYGAPKGAFSQMHSLKKVDTINGEPVKISPLDTSNMLLCECVNLKKFDFSGITTIQSYIMQAAIKNLNLTNCTEVLRTYGLAYGNSFLEKIELPLFCGKLPKNAFASCPSLTDADIRRCTELDEQVFQNCYTLKEIDIPNCTSIGANAFNNCYTLEKVNAPNCTNIGNYAFSNCTNLKDITLADNCTYGSNCFNGCYSLYPRPDGSVN